MIGLRMRRLEKKTIKYFCHLCQTRGDKKDFFEDNPSSRVLGIYRCPECGSKDILVEVSIDTTYKRKGTESSYWSRETSSSIVSLDEWLKMGGEKDE